MKYLYIILLAVVFPIILNGQVQVGKNVDWIRCAVAHGTSNGWFSCDFNGTFYPYRIFDSTIRKWFIKIDNGDSLFYYKSIIEEIYIWNGRPKNEEYGYQSEEMRNTGLGITISDRYTTDTLKFKKQKWGPKP